jgi:sodium-dependent dicarboxylate transporter 2/3/5
MSAMKAPPESGNRGYQRVGLVLGPVLCALVLVLPAPAGMAAAAWDVTAVAALMAVWWATEAIPVPVTALIPLLLFPLLGLGSAGEAAAPYANPLIFLFLGGFMIALAMERWNLHRRIALNVVRRVGAHPLAIVAGFMAATAGLSMWVSNTATTMMMLPIAASVIAVFLAEEAESDGPQARNFATACMLGIAYAASIGGLATLVGTPPNALLAAFMSQSHGLDIGFAAWMGVGLPVTLALLPLAWLVLTRVVYPFDLPHAREAAGVVDRAHAEMGQISRPELRVAAVFALVAGLWIFRPLLSGLPGLGGLTDPGIAILGGVLLFLIPSGAGSGFLLDWEWAKKLPWGVLILFGGGLSLAAAASRTGLAQWIGDSLAGLGAWPLLGLAAVVTVVVILLTELTSNTATTAAFLPVVASIAVATGADPLMLAAPAALAASCAFMLPVATPPNAIVFASGHVTIPQMVRAGAVLNLVAAAAISLLPWLLLPVIFDLAGAGR